MATKPSVSTDTVTADQDVETTLLDVQSAAVKRLIARGKERGFITFDELNAVLPSEQNSSEQIEDVMANLSEMGIQVVEGEETEDGDAPVAKVEKTEGEGDAEEPTGNVDEESLGRTDDPVRMYLREMGSVELLSREGEIAIAKRIEAGRDMMIGGLCESPLTFKAIISWHDQLKAGRMLLRDIVDLEATQGAGQPPPGVLANGEGGEAVAEGVAANGAEPAFAEPAEELDDGEDGEGPGMSLSALEEKLKPEVLATFEEIEALYKKLHKMQHKRLETMTSGDAVNVRSEKNLREIPRGTGQQSRAGAPAQQPHRGTGHPTQTAQPAPERVGGVAAAHGRRLQGGRARDFLKQYRGHELDPAWIERMAALTGKGWKLFTAKHFSDIGGRPRADRRGGQRRPACRSASSAAST